MLNRLILIFSVLFILSFNVHGQENCNDGIDNDGDGLVDCNDPDCVFPPTIEQGCNCEDGIDNDSDGKIDSLDPDCASYYGLLLLNKSLICCSEKPKSLKNKIRLR